MDQLLSKLEAHVAAGLSSPGFHLSEDDMKRIIVALREQQQGQSEQHAEFGEPVAWIFQLASSRDQATGEYSGWREMIQVGRPVVPEGSIRNLRPLYVGYLVYR